MPTNKPKHVIDQDGFVLAKISRNRRQYTKRFRFSSPSEKPRAMKAARAWVEHAKRSLPPAGNGPGVLRIAPLAGKQTGEPVGVSRTIVPAGNPARPGSLRYMVNWVDASGRGRVKAFVAGPLDIVSEKQIRHARKAAHAFRQAYENSIAEGAQFDHKQFEHWREMKF